MNDFFNNLEHSDSLAFSINSIGKVVSVKEIEYLLYDSSVYPLVEFSEELKALNDYCYTVVQSIKNELSEVKEERGKYWQNPYDDSDCLGNEATLFEIMMGLENRQYRWEWLLDITSAHLVILWYAYLEKTLKYIYKWYMDEKLISSQYKIKKPAVNFWLYNILNMDDDSFRNSEPELYRVLNAARRMRNNFAHDNLEGADLENGDYIYGSRKYEPDFQLTDLIHAISVILYKAEQILTR